jgi:hypothetical protein
MNSASFCRYGLKPKPSPTIKKQDRHSILIILQNKPATIKKKKQNIAPKPYSIPVLCPGIVQ